MCDYNIIKQVHVVFFSLRCSLAARCVARRWRDLPFPAQATYVYFKILLFIRAHFHKLLNKFYILYV